MKKFHIFAGYDFYPSGGVSDYLKSVETLEEVEDILKTTALLERFDWFNVAALNEDGSLKPLYKFIISTQIKVTYK